MRRLAFASILALLSAAAVVLSLPDEEAFADAPLQVAAPALSRPTGQRGAVVTRWAPTIYQETRGSRDLLTAFDFDGDWDGSNNAAHVTHYPLRAVVYYTVAETPSHWLVTYLLYHPVDAKTLVGHDHDTEHVTMAVRKDGTPTGRLEMMETRFHKWLFQYAVPGSSLGGAADDIDGPVHFDAGGRPEVYVQRVGHGVCGGYAPPSWFDTFALRCRHAEAPHLGEQGVVYRYSGEASVPRDPDDRSAGYGLVEIGDSLWRHAREIGPNATFHSSMDYNGDRCAQFDCPQRIGARLLAARGHLSTGMPWEEGGGRGSRHPGDAFFDPAWTLSRRLTFGAPFSTEYLYNPYLGVGSFDEGPRGPLLAEEIVAPAASSAGETALPAAALATPVPAPDSSPLPLTR